MENKGDLKILVVDDMVTVRSLIKISLRKIGINDILEAFDGLEAWEKIEACINNNTPIDLVLCDWNMPNMNGLDLLRKIRTNEKTKHLPMILVTAEASKDHLVAAKLEGANGYVVKPINEEKLIDKIRTVLKLEI